MYITTVLKGRKIFAANVYLLPLAEFDQTTPTVEVAFGGVKGSSVCGADGKAVKEFSNIGGSSVVNF